jgi:truncated hemoglobin YjbI
MATVKSAKAAKKTGSGKAVAGKPRLTREQFDAKLALLQQTLKDIGEKIEEVSDGLDELRNSGPGESPSSVRN